MSPSQTVNLTGADVISIQRSGLTPADFQGVTGTPFNPVQFPGVVAAEYEDSPAWFSLVMIGGKNVQLYWFKNDPGAYSSSNQAYKLCTGPGSMSSTATFAANRPTLPWVFSCRCRSPRRTR